MKKNMILFLYFLLISLIVIVIMIFFTFFKNMQDNEYNLDTDNLENKTDNQLNSQNSNKDKLKVCPEKWYIDNTPCDCNENGCESCNIQYVVINGVIYNINLIDVEWMISNCNIILESQKP